MKIKTVNVIFFFYFISLGLMLLGSSGSINDNFGVWQIDPSVLYGLAGVITVGVSIIFILITLRAKETT